MHIAHIAHIAPIRAGRVPATCLFRGPVQRPPTAGGTHRESPPRSLKRPARPQRDRIPAFYSTPIDIFLFFFFPL